MKLKNKMHEWAADHFSFVQYPNVYGPINGTHKQSLFAWRNDMPLGMRILLALVSLFWIIVLSGVLIAIAMFAWAFIGAVISFH